MKLKILWCTIFLMLSCGIGSAQCFRKGENSAANEEIADAIYLAEGGAKAKYLFVIRSIIFKDTYDARRICLNTIRNQRRRHANHECGYTFLECLQRRYCPINAKNDPRGLNQYWLGNVRYFLMKNRRKGELRK